MQHKKLEPGNEFPSTTFKITPTILSKYLKAVEESSNIYISQAYSENESTEALVPPMAVATYAIRTLYNSFSDMMGAIHISQEFEFLKPVYVNTKVTCKAKVTSMRKRGEMHLLIADLSAFNENKEIVLSGRSTVLLP